MKYLITGGCGFLGSNLASEVLKRGEKLYIFDNLSRTGAIQNLEWLKSLGTFQFINGDIRNSDDIEIAIKEIKPDIIFHLAGQVAMTTSIENPRKDFEINTIGTFNILEAVRKYNPITTIIYSSTNKVYGDLEYLKYKTEKTRYVLKDYPDGLDESINLSFSSPYGCSKGAADQYMIDYHKIYGLNTVVFRHSSMYGGRQFATYDQGWIGWFCGKAIEKKNQINTKPFTISGNGKQVRDVLHAKDMIALYFSAVEKRDIIGGQVFNIGGGLKNSLSLLELLDILEKETKTKLEYTILPARQSDQKVFIANTKKAKKLLNWSPKISSNEGIADMLKWIENR